MMTHQGILLKHADDRQSIDMPTLLPAPARSRVEIRQRDAYFDALKGFLVLVMVGHHTLEYFAGRDFTLIKYLDFVTGGFVFAAGFLPSFLLESRPVADRAKVVRRLLTRGFKLLLVFIVANILIGLVTHQNARGKSFGVDVFFVNVWTIFLGGDKSLAAFAILVPIAYTLIVCSVLTSVAYSRSVTCGIAAALVSYSTWQQNPSFNIYFLSMGLAGAAAGTLIDRRLIVSADRIGTRVALSFGSAAYMALITVLHRDNAALYTTGIFFVLAAAYAYAKVLEPYDEIFAAFVILGRYSLLAYLAQIFFLQLILRTSARSLMEWGFGLIPLMLTTAFLCGLCFGLDVLQQRNARVSHAYRLIFA